jgi:oligopeptide transport system permease protein
MFHFLLTKSLRAITILVSVTLITFLLVHAIPGNPWDNYSSSPRIMLDMGLDKSLKRELNRRFGLDLPLWRQYTRYIVGDLDEDGRFFCGVVCGNLGPSIQQRGRSVQHVLFAPPAGMTIWESRFGYSIRLVLFGSLIAVGLGIPLGIWSAAKPGSVLSHTISIGLTALISIPNFVLGLLAVIVLASWLKLIKVLPDWNIPSNWIIPAVVLAAIPMANIARVTRASLMNILNEDYIRTARGKGLTETRVMLVHMLRNALPPIITFIGITLMELFTGLLIVENLYGFPGIGRGYWEAVLVLDYPMIMGLTLFYAIGIMLVNIVVEFLCEILDPRIRSVKHQGAA